jgi:hypothetical protein
MEPIKPADIGGETTTTTTTEGQKTTVTVTKKWNVGTADVGVIGVVLLLGLLFLLSLFIEGLRDALGGQFDALVGVLTLAVGGIGAFKLIKGRTATTTTTTTPAGPPTTS